MAPEADTLGHIALGLRLNPAEAAIMIGQKLGSYEVVAKLGEGGMGSVYRARDSRLGRDVAIKVVLEAFVADRDRLLRFEREARVLAALNHPNIATLRLGGGRWAPRPGDGVGRGPNVG